MKTPTQELKKWAISGIRAEISRLERQIEKLHDEMKQLLTARKKPVARFVPPKKKNTEKLRWSDERKQKFRDALRAKKAAAATPQEVTTETPALNQDQQDGYSGV